MKIKVFVTTVQENHVIYANDQRRSCVLLDTKETSYDVDRFIFKITDMCSNWPNELENKKIIDGLEYRIVIKENEKITSYTFKNKFPDNINKLQKLIDDVMGVVKSVD